MISPAPTRSRISANCDATARAKSEDSSGAVTKSPCSPNFHVPPTCRRLHAAGANLMLHYRASAGEARLLQAELNHQRKDSVALIQADLLDVVKLPSLIDQTAQTFGRLDALVNNASSFYSTPI